MDEDIDIDGDDQVIFGEAQFTERDIVPVSRPQEDIDEEDVEVEIEGDDHDDALVAAGKAPQRRIPEQTDDSGPPRMDVTGMTEATKSELAIVSARQRGDKSALVVALENKIKLMVGRVIVLTNSLSEPHNFRVGIYRFAIKCSVMQNMY